MIELPIEQAEILQDLFERFFKDDYTYFSLVPIDEVFCLLIGSSVALDFYDRLEKTVYKTDEDLSFCVFLHEFMKSIIEDVEQKAQTNKCEFWELANNCQILKNKLHGVIHTPDSGDLS